MPRSPFESYVEEHFSGEIGSIAQVSRIAKHFKVSLRATALRLERLGLAVDGLGDDVDSEADFNGGGG